ncbi:hypothetical protein CDD83_8640 [Cordyceps sp. RAO-2017]|nr:hypothetical protein CDD83_8640 [Cordyceps sp. RAO-2017]
MLDRSKVRAKSGNTIKDFACFGQLDEARHRCSFCDLLWKAIHRYSDGEIGDSCGCSLTWEVDGRQMESGWSRDGRRIETDQSQDNHLPYMRSTRRIRVTWHEDSGRTQEVHVVCVAPEDPTRPNSDASDHWTAEHTHFLGRDLGNGQEKHALIRGWLKMCQEEHGQACRDAHGTEREFKELIGETYFGVVDVADLQLKRLPLDRRGEPAPFVALSYVWGRLEDDEPPYCTTRANVATHILHGGLEGPWDKLPLTIQDAILLVSRLGERYLWIDSLCIVQDSVSSWQLNAKAMHLVYGNASFTICAADGKSAMAGLSAVNASARAASAHAGGSSDFIQMSGECVPGVRLMITRPLEAVINDSDWNKRAWTFQERILSRRCVIFAEGRVYFQCRTTGFSQDIHASGKAVSWSLDQTNSSHRTLVNLQRRPVWFYMKYVNMYTGRSLTKPQDILAAFQGITWLLESYMNAPFLFGIPASHFDLCLLWMAQGELDRRGPKQPTTDSGGTACSQDAKGNCTCRQDDSSLRGDEFPSWSWSGWRGGPVCYDSEMLSGCLLNVRQWLKDHTWIQWHIRDASGHLGPLWDLVHRPCGSLRKNRARQERERTETGPGSPENEDRWRGYRTKAWDREPLVDDDINLDSYGRHKRSEHAFEWKRFKKCLPDNPFGVIQDRYMYYPLPRDPSEAMDMPPWPDEPSRATQESHRPRDLSSLRPILQFFTWTVDLHVSAREQAGPVSASDAERPAAPVCYCDIFDREGDWCGSILLPRRLLSQYNGSMFHFIAISDAKSFTPQECPVWTYYVPKERDESEWDLYFALLAEFNIERGVFERVGLGKIFKAAFDEELWREVRLG